MRLIVDMSSGRRVSKVVMKQQLGTDISLRLLRDLLIAAFLIHLTVVLIGVLQTTWEPLYSWEFISLVIASTALMMVIWLPEDLKQKGGKSKFIRCFLRSLKNMQIAAIY